VASHSSTASLAGSAGDLRRANDAVSSSTSLVGAAAVGGSRTSSSSVSLLESSPSPFQVQYTYVPSQAVLPPHMAFDDWASVAQYVRCTRLLLVSTASSPPAPASSHHHEQIPARLSAVHGSLTPIAATVESALIEGYLQLFGLAPTREQVLVLPLPLVR
jgi:hypothetical protein